MSEFVAAPRWAPPDAKSEVIDPHLTVPITELIGNLLEIPTFNGFVFALFDFSQRLKTTAAPEGAAGSP